MVEASIRAYRPAARAKNIEIQECLGAPHAVIDRDRIRQVVDHLVDNAVKFTPRDGSVRVELDETDETAVIHICDTGCGVTSECQDRIFHKFFQSENPLTRSAGGMGIGLYLARCLVELHGGSIRLVPQTRVGSEFIVELPKKPGTPCI